MPVGAAGVGARLAPVVGVVVPEQATSTRVAARTPEVSAVVLRDAPARSKTVRVGFMGVLEMPGQGFPDAGHLST
jgi:hypothetical protein